MFPLRLAALVLLYITLWFIARKISTRLYAKRDRQREFERRVEIIRQRERRTALAQLDAYRLYLRMTKQREMELPETLEARIALAMTLSRYFRPMTQEEMDAGMLLGVSANATSAEIRRAFRTKAWKTHPDLVPARDRDAAHDRFRVLDDAQRTLLSRPARLKALGFR